MTITLLAFGIAKDIVGKQKLVVIKKNPATVASLRTSLKKSYPKLGDIPHLMIAVNNKYAKDTDKLHTNDEVALIPPTNGG